MPTWEDLFAEGKLISRYPESEVLRFAANLGAAFAERPLRFWDLCCGAGRHVKALVGAGHAAFGSDVSPTGIRLTRALLDEHEFDAELAVSDMTACPWPEERFHGVLSWDALHHNTFDRIREAVAVVHQHLLPGGCFLLNLKSTKADSYGRGREIEPATFVPEGGPEEGVPHRFFTEAEVRELFAEFEVLVLVDQVMDYRERGEGFVEINPFAYTRWGILARRPAGAEA